MDNRYNRHNRRKYSLKVHIVLVTKYRNYSKVLSLMMLSKRFSILLILMATKLLLWKPKKTIYISY